MTSHDRNLRHNRKYVVRIPAFFSLTIVVQNVPLRMTGSSMATGCDVSESDVTGSDVTGIDVIRPKVGDYPWGEILIVRGVCGTPMVFSITFTFSLWYLY